MKQALFLFFTAWLLAPGNALAMEPPQDSHGQDKTEIEEVIVAATRADLTIRDIPVNTSILSRQDVLESAYKPTDEILRQIPGFSLLRAADSIAAAPTTSTVSLRGLGGNAASRTLVLLDGFPIHSPYSTEIFWARVPRHRIERVEVIRGGGANAWGNLSLGGVINIVTKKPGDRDLDFNAMVGYPKTADLAVSGNRKLGDWNLGGSASGYTTDGYMNLPPEQQGPVDEAVRKDHGTVSGRASWAPDERTRVNFQAGAFRETRHGGSALDINETEIRTLGVGVDRQASGGGWWRLKLFYEDSGLEDASVSIVGDNESETLRGFESRPASVLGAGLVHSLPTVRGHDLSFGADYRWADVSVDEWSRYTENRPARRLTTDSRQDMGGVFVQDTWRIDARWRASASLRYDYIVNSASSLETDLETGEISGAETYQANSESTPNGNLGFRFQAMDGISLRAAAYTGFRAPTLRELYYAASTRGGVILVNNPDLEPERLVGLEAGADFDLGGSTLLRLTLFRNTVKDLVQNITRGQTGDQPGIVEPCGLMGANETCRELDNVGEMRATGLELEGDVQLSPGWDLQLSYLFNDTEISKSPDNPQLVGNQVRQAPKHAFTTRLRNSNRWFNGSLLARYVGKRYEDDLNQLEVDDFLLFDLRFSRRLSESTELFLAIENLLDEAYEIKVENNGAIEIGRPRFVGLGLRIQR
ncbi:MAG: TonB-dependent receptor [Xanthomonadales bacterium]|jgi:outer membrane receptor protein involved in Fe transport|nr:TonB-dependent receptor [Xanthomonadales bacterium]